jgi:lipopolysaccharide biosynthesis protein
MTQAASTLVPADATGAARRPRLVAFYLPQFHPTPENDAWWGRGFTEWTNVARAEPLYPGHRQPRRPADLGYYDLRLPDTRAVQAELASRNGIEAFCYYHYWFHGTRLLQRPFDDVRSSGEPDFPFCLCWANEPWGRSWTGNDQHELMPQAYSHADDVAHAQYLAEAFADPRYLRTADRPVFLIYRPSHMSAPAATIEAIRAGAMREGIPDPYIVLCDGHEAGADMRAPYGADMTLRYEPQLSVLPGGLTELPPWKRALTNVQFAREFSSSLRLYDYARSRSLMRAVQSSGPSIRTVLVRWDNTPRRGSHGIIMTGATPDAFGRELRSELERPDWNSSGTDLLFLNAWNEWAEGNYLEPDEEYGHAYLDQVRMALVEYEASVVASAAVRR